MGLDMYINRRSVNQHHNVVYWRACPHIHNIICDSVECPSQIYGAVVLLNEEDIRNILKRIKRYLEYYSVNGYEKTQELCYHGYDYELKIMYLKDNEEFKKNFEKSLEEAGVKLLEVLQEMRLHSENAFYYQADW